MPVIALPLETLRFYNCRIMRGQIGYDIAIEDLSFGDVVHFTTWADVELTDILAAYKRTGDGIQLNVTHAEFKRWLDKMTSDRESWRKVTSTGNFKRLVNISNRMNRNINTLFSWMPPEAIPDNPNESSKP